jgi:hypothetical protein
MWGIRQKDSRERGLTVDIDGIVAKSVDERSVPTKID